MIFCGEDRATGEHAEAAKDITNKRTLPSKSKSIETNEVNMDSVQDTFEVGNDNEVTSPEAPVSRSQEPKAKRSRKSKDENEDEGIKMALRDIAGALRESTVICNIPSFVVLNLLLFHLRSESDLVA